jgi:hypothetical protein
MENINWAGFSSPKLCDPVPSSVIFVHSLTNFADSLKLGMEQKTKDQRRVQTGEDFTDNFMVL